MSTANVNGFVNGHSKKHQTSNGLSVDDKVFNGVSIDDQTNLWIGNDRSGKCNIIKQLVELLIDPSKLKQISDSSSVVQFKQPKELEDLLGFPLGQQSLTNEELMDFVKRVIKYSVKTSHPYFYNQLYGGIDDFSLAGSWLTDALNTSQATYEISPVFTILERRLMKHLGSFCGWPDESIDGIFAPGGSMANIFGIILARHQKFPQVKKDGIASLPGPGVIFASEDSHYSFVKGCIWMGHGSSAVIKVKTDAAGCMDANDLVDKINQALDDGKVPFMIAATAGTTVLSAFDPIKELAAIAKKFNIWLHVDAALGGTVLFSRKYRCLMDGIDEADSVTWNLHKLGGIPLQCSVFLTKHPTLLASANCLNAEYLFQSDKYYDASYDSGDKSIQCGRKVDSLKLYLALLGRGTAQMEDLVDNIFECADYLTEKLRKSPNFVLVLPKFQCNNICFWYVPPEIIDEHNLHSFTIDGNVNGTVNGSNTQASSSLTHLLSSQPPQSKLSTQLSKVCPALKLQMMNEGQLMINYQPLTSKKLPNFFRMVLTCIPPSNKSHMDFVVDHLSQIAKTVDWSKIL